jgi:uncharacterized protein YcbX
VRTTLDGVRLSSLRIHPVKSTAGIAVREAPVQPWGLDHDRRWMVVDRDGVPITARENRTLLHVTATPRSNGGIDLSAPGLEPLRVDVPPAGVQVPVTTSRVDSALSAGAAADSWMSTMLQRTVRLVWLDDPRRRSVGTSHGGQPGDTLNLSDAGPVLLTSTSSLVKLNDWLQQTAAERGEAPPEPIPMARFRPNVVIDGVQEPFAEDDWKLVRVGEVELRFAEHCDRCVLTTIDPVTLAGGMEPTRTLALRRQWDHEVFFGIRLVPVSSGTLRVGDPVRVS